MRVTATTASLLLDDLSCRSEPRKNVSKGSATYRGMALRNVNPFIGNSPVDTLNNCRRVLELMTEAQPSAGESISEETIAARQLIYNGVSEALNHATRHPTTREAQRDQ